MQNTALHQAANKGDVTSTLRFIEHGIPVDSIGKGGWTPLEIAIYKGHIDVVRILLEKGATIRPGALHIASEYGYKNIILLLLEWGADPSSLNGQGKTALELAENEEIRGILDTPNPH